MNKDKEENIFGRILQFMYRYSLDGVILVGFALVFFAATGTYLYGVFFWKTLPTGGDLLTLLGIILAILGLGGAAIYLWIYRKVEEAIKKDWEQEGRLSKAQTARVLGIFYSEIYATVYKEVTKKDDANKKAKGQIDHALHFFKEAVAYIKEINEGELNKKPVLRDLLINKNNVAHCLVTKWNYYKDKLTRKQFKDFLEKKENKELAKDYIAEKTLAENYISDILKPEDLCNFDDLIRPFKNTERLVKEAFSTEPIILD